ncbi:MAG: SAM-dependent methyltransferase [Thermoprotei archaeon]|nr:MAG: SAM-dependent methyltransferase [Thermoprotei archaeon]
MSGLKAGVNERIIRELTELPYLPSPYSVIRAAFRLARLRRGELVVDLGCGDGRALVVAAREYGAYAVGVELNPLLVKLAVRECILAGVRERVEIIHGDLFLFDVSRFDVIYCYPSPAVSRRLSLKLVSECKPGCRVVVHDHPLIAAEPVRVLSLPSQGPHIHKIYLYVSGISWPQI